MKIKTFIALAMTAMLALLGLNTYVGINANNKLSRLLDYISGPAWNAADGAMEGQIGLEAQILLLQRVYHRDVGMAEVEQQYADAKAMEEEALGRMQASGLMDAATLRQLQSLLQEFHSNRAALEQRLAANTPAQAEYNKLGGQLSTLLEFIGAMEEEADSKVENEKSHVEDLRAHTQLAMSVMLMVSLVFGGIFVLLCRRIILQPLGALNDNLMDLASGAGDLTTRLKGSQADTEIGHLSRYFNSFVEKLQRLIQQTQASNQSLTVASVQITRGITQTADGINLQFREISRVAQLVETIAATLDNVVTAAERANSASEQAAVSTDAGNQIVAATHNAAHEIAQEVDKASLVISALVEDSRNIGAILEVIRSIAEQTNLLALNAAIEAARAGDSGRGFAVVADEVRNLASRTQESTKSIEKIIANLANGSARAVDVMGEAQKKAVLIQERIGSTARAFAEIVQVVQEIKRINREIVTATDEERHAMEQISDSMNNILRQAQKNHDAGTEICASREHLESELGKMNGLLAGFRT